MVEEIVQSEAPRASVKPVGAEPYLLRLPRSEVAAAVPVPLVVPPADSMVRLMELSTVPVTVRVPLDVAAEAAAVSIMVATVATAILLIIGFSLLWVLLRVGPLDGPEKYVS